jgi:hypothetical protein
MSRLSFLATLLLLFMGTTAAQVTVDTTLDGDDGECLVDCTIREAAATAIPGEIVVVPAGTYSVSLGAIVLDRDLAIIGDGARHTIIRGTGTPQRLLIVAVGASVEIADVTLSLEPAQLNGGGIHNDGDLLLRECWLRDAFLTHQCCGGALHNRGTATVERCTMSNNIAEFGGAIFNEGLMVIESTTISGNANTFEAGGILNGGDLTLIGSTVVGNEAAVAGAANLDTEFASLVLRNTVVGDGVNGPDCMGVPDATAGHNVDSDGTCLTSGGPGNSTADANLAPLADNGGPVPTHALNPGSPLIDAGNPAVVTRARRPTRAVSPGPRGRRATWAPSSWPRVRTARAARPTMPTATASAERRTTVPPDSTPGRTRSSSRIRCEPYRARGSPGASPPTSPSYAVT